MFLSLGVVVFFLFFEKQCGRIAPPGFTLQTAPMGGGWLCAGVSSGSGVRVTMGEGGKVELTESWRGSGRRVRSRIEASEIPGGVRIEAERALDGARRVYVARMSGGVVLASHMAVLKSLGIAVQIEERSLAEAMLYRFVMAPRTMFKGVGQLRAGERRRLEVDDGGVREQTLSVFRAEAGTAGGTEETGDRIWEQLLGVHRAYGIEAAEFGTLLSGGLDSSILTMIGARLYGRKRTYSCSYGLEPPESDRELQYARSAAEWLGTEHSVLVPTRAEYLHSLVDCALDAEQSSLHLQSGLVSLAVRERLAPAGVRTWTCGEGADGVFGQKIQRLVGAMNQRPLAKFGLGLGLSRVVLGWLSGMTNRYGMLADMAGRVWGPGTALDDPRHVLWSTAIFGEREWVGRHMKGDPTAGRVECLRPYADGSDNEKFFALNLLGEVTETQAVWAAESERLGVEAIYPFTAPEFVTEVNRVPWEVRLERPKGLLRDMSVRKGLPRGIAERPKASFDIRPSFYGPRGSILDPLTRVAAGGFDAGLLDSLRSTNVFRSQMFFTALNVGLVRRHFELGHTREQLHEELNASIRDLGFGEQMTAPAQLSAG